MGNQKWTTKEEEAFLRKNVAGYEAAQAIPKVEGKPNPVTTFLLDFFLPMFFFLTDDEFHFWLHACISINFSFFRIFFSVFLFLCLFLSLSFSLFLSFYLAALSLILFWFFLSFTPFLYLCLSFLDLLDLLFRHFRSLSLPSFSSIPCLRFPSCYCLSRSFLFFPFGIANPKEEIFTSFTSKRDQMPRYFVRNEKEKVTEIKKKRGTTGIRTQDLLLTRQTH